MDAPEQMLRFGVPVVLGIAGAVVLDRMCAARGVFPPGFHVLWRRLLAGAAVAGLLALGVFAPLGSLGLTLEPDFTKITTPQLFALHFLMLAALGMWFLMGYAGRVEPPRPDPLPLPLPLSTPALVEPAPNHVDGLEALERAVPPPAEPVPPPAPPPRPSLGSVFAAQFGFRTPNVWREVGLGVVLGIGAWMVVLLALMGVAGVLWAVGGEDAVPRQPPALVPFIAGLPILVRALISLSAGVVEETFFRGFLQPRVGIVLSTVFFALAHLSYGQPFMLIGITLLSLIYGLLVKWRQNVWAAITAHTFFDGVQLLVIVPSVLRMLQATGAKTAAYLAGLL
ncbi:MAG TPA: CPBP family intramembrane glutamic endopeptidase [Thermoanaerobaculia bacterium]|jgi:membrane protease YdiL (CAAX protease family)|nr:CPBP family intramembrane glutamic endopeptidase [Thermoanaerobaculia bacterium]